MSIYPGTQVSVHGTVAANLKKESRYILDERPPVTYRTQSVTDDVPLQLFYQSPPLEDGKHTLHALMTSGAGPYTLDFISYVPSTPAQASPAVVLGVSLGIIIPLLFILAIVAIVMHVARTPLSRKKAIDDEESQVDARGTLASSFVQCVLLTVNSQHRPHLPGTPSQSDHSAYSERHACHV